MTTEAERIEAILAEHMHEGYFETKDGHRECFCGHVMAEGERYREHLAAALVAAETGGLAERWKPEDGDTKCQECHRPNAPWFAENGLWNAVLTDRVEAWLDGEPMGGDPGAVLCPSCFTRRAETAGVKTVWQLVPQWSRRAAPMHFRDDEALAQPAPSDAMDQAIAESPTLKESP